MADSSPPNSSRAAKFGGCCPSQPCGLSTVRNYLKRTKVAEFKGNLKENMPPNFSGCVPNLSYWPCVCGMCAHGLLNQTLENAILAPAVVVVTLLLAAHTGVQDRLFLRGLTGGLQLK